MSPETKLLLAAGAAVSLPFLLAPALEGQEQKTLAKDLTTIGLVGTLIGVPVGLWAIPRMSTLGAASVLTLVGLGVKFLLLGHEEVEDARSFMLTEPAV